MVCRLDSYDTFDDWKCPDSIVDDNTSTCGIFDIVLPPATDYWKPPNSVIVLNSNSCITDSTQVITKVELRATSVNIQLEEILGIPECTDVTLVFASGCDVIVHGVLEPVFTAGIGDEHAYLTEYILENWFSVTYPQWSNWLDITDDTNAPATWTWNDIHTLDVNHFPRYTCADGCEHLCCLVTCKVEMRVTWSESVQMYFPRIIDGGLSKNIDIFNLWKTTVKTRDSGLNSQPYRFSGVMMPICSAAHGVVLCFPICFPLCFEEGVPEEATSAQTVFQTIHEWIENHDKITISCYGQCADGEYIIKHFSTRSMRSPDYYKYDLTLEKVRD